jgi:NAD(P)-dependent dehydrogenase (short-subunit alcohol dehydrogenase family)
MRELRGKKVLITGGARGIGRAIALEFAGAGCELLLGDIHPAELDLAVEAVRGRGVQARGYALDVTNVAAIAATRRKILDDAGPIDVLVNNAGVVFGGPFLEVPLERHLLTYRVNVEGVVAMTHAFLPDLLDRPEGHVVNVASASGLLALPRGSTYASSKWAVIGFSESLRQELAQRHAPVGVTTVCPSYVSTGMFDGVRPPWLTPILTPERLAGKVVAAVRTGKRMVLEPWMVKTLPLLKGVLPGAIFDAIAGIFGVTSSMTGWKGRVGSGA